MSGNNVRLQAIRDVEAYVPPAVSFEPGEAPGEIFGENVFSRAVMQKRLPKRVFTSVMATIENSAPLDPQVADAVATAFADHGFAPPAFLAATASAPGERVG